VVKKPSITDSVMKAGFAGSKTGALAMVSKKNLKIVEKYVFLGEFRYRVQIVGTNIVLNVKADSDEEALNKASELAKTIGLTDEYVEKLREKYKE